MTVTLANIRSEARQRADMVNSTFVSDSELNGYINNAYRRLYHKVADKHTERLISATPTSFTVSSGNTQALASDFFRLWGIDFQESSGNWVALQSWMPTERNHRHQYVSRYYDRIKYRVLGSVLMFTPEDNCLGTYRYWYVPTVTILSGDSSEINSEFERTGWYEYVVIEAARKCLAKEESDTRELTKEGQLILAAIDEEALNRDLSMPQRVQDVRFIDDDDPYLLRW